MRTNAMTMIETQIKGYSKEQLKNCAINALTKILHEMQNLVSINDMETINTYTSAMFIIGAKLGIGGDGMMNNQEKEIFDAVYALIFPGETDIPESLYDQVSSQITEIDYAAVEKVCNDLDEDTVMNFLLYILSIAYIDGAFEDQVADRLDEIFGFKLGVWYLKNGFGGENIKVSSRSSNSSGKIKLSGFEAEVYQWFKNDNRLHPLKDIQTHFSRKSQSEIQGVLDELCAKGVLMGGERIVGNSYCLTNEVEVEISKDVKKKPSTSSRIQKTDEKESHRKEEKEKKQQKLNEEKQALERTAIECEEHFEMVKKEFARMEKEYKKELKEVIKKVLTEYNKKIDLVKNKQNICIAEKHELGMFQFSKKKVLKNEIKQLKTFLKLKQDPQEISRMNSEMDNRVTTLSKKYSEAIKVRLDSQFPQHHIKKKEDQQFFVRTEVLKALLMHQNGLTVSDIIKNSTYLSKIKVTNAQVSAVVRSLCSSLLVERKEVKGVAYFYPVCGFESIQEDEIRRYKFLIDMYQEVAEFASQPYPIPEVSPEYFYKECEKHLIEEFAGYIDT